MVGDLWQIFVRRKPRIRQLFGNVYVLEVFFYTNQTNNSKRTSCILQFSPPKSNVIQNDLKLSCDQKYKHNNSTTISDPPRYKSFLGLNRSSRCCYCKLKVPSVSYSTLLYSTRPYKGSSNDSFVLFTPRCCLSITGVSLRYEDIYTYYCLA